YENPNCAEGTSYLTTLPSPDISPHKCAHIAAQKNTHIRKHIFFFLFLLSDSVRTNTVSC
uniref:Uncharacterized protein n=1 Tax=Anabas testudineus TaxID=64144 RepID=A0A3Q1J8E7_ANATE